MYDNPFFLISSFLLGFVLPFIIFNKIKETTGNTLLTLALAGIIFGIIYQFEDTLLSYSPITIYTSVFYLGFWAAIFFSIISAGAKYTVSTFRTIGKVMKPIARYTEKAIKETKREIKEVKKEEKIIKSIKSKVSKALKYIFEDPEKSIKLLKEAYSETLEVMNKVKFLLREEVEESELLENIEKWDMFLEKYKHFRNVYIQYFLSTLEREVLRERKLIEEIKKEDIAEERTLEDIYKDLQRLAELIRTLISLIKWKNYYYDLRRWYNNVTKIVEEMRTLFKKLEKDEKRLAKLVKEELSLEKKLEKEESKMKKVMKNIGNKIKKFGKKLKI